MTKDTPEHSPCCCKSMADYLADEDIAISYSAKFREYGVKVLDGGSAYVVIYFCPWCGERLPQSLRDLWFDRIEQMGLEPESADVPADFTTDRWWREANL